MKWLALSLSAFLLAVTPVSAREVCESGGYDAVLAPDHASLTILFDNMVTTAGAPRARCSFSIPLDLPAGTSLGVYKVDYRGFAVLQRKETAVLEVDYAFGAREAGRRFKRQVKGSHEGEFTFTENIGAGLMKRVGCGNEAKLSGSVTLSLQSAAEADALAALDSSDGTARQGLVYYFDLKPCPR